MSDIKKENVERAIAMLRRQRYFDVAEYFEAVHDGNVRDCTCCDVLLVKKTPDRDVQKEIQHIEFTEP